MVSKTIGALHLGSSTLPLGVGNVDRFSMHFGARPVLRSCFSLIFRMEDAFVLWIGGSVEIPDLTSLPEINDEPVFDGYRKGGYLSCQMAGQIRENGQKAVSKCDEG
jgi:hypothetical protein